MNYGSPCIKNLALSNLLSPVWECPIKGSTGNSTKQVVGLNVVCLLMIKIHITIHASTRQYTNFYKRVVPLSSLRVSESFHDVLCVCVCMCVCVCVCAQSMNTSCERNVMNRHVC